MGRLDSLLLRTFVSRWRDARFRFAIHSRIVPCSIAADNDTLLVDDLVALVGAENFVGIHVAGCPVFAFDQSERAETLSLISLGSNP